MKKRSICLYSILWVAVSLVLVGCGDAKNEVDKVNHDLKVEVIRPLTDSIYKNNDFIGTIESPQEVTVMPKMSGKVTEKYFDVGDSVNVGDLLFVLDDEAAQFNIAKAQNALKTAMASFKSSTADFEAQVASANAIVVTIASKGTQLENSKESAQRTLEEAEKARILAEESTKILQKLIQKFEADLEEANDSLQDYEDAEDNYLDLIDKYDRIQGYVDAGDWERFNSNTEKNYNLKRSFTVGISPLLAA